MKTRIITGVLGGLAFVYAIVTGGFLEVVTGLLLAVGVWEYHRLAGSAGIKTNFPCCSAQACFIFFIQVCSVLNHRFAVVEYTGFVLFLHFDRYFLFRDQDQGLAFCLRLPQICLVWSIRGSAYIYHFNKRYSTPFGWQVLLFIFITIWGNDTGAYFIGSFLGKTPLAPKISPHKTVEGSVGGLLVGALAGIGFGLAFGFPGAYWR